MAKFQVTINTEDPALIQFLEALRNGQKGRAVESILRIWTHMGKPVPPCTTPQRGAIELENLRGNLVLAVWPAPDGAVWAGLSSGEQVQYGRFGEPLECRGWQ